MTRPGRLTFLGIAIWLVAAGLILRLAPWRLPLLVHHNGGGILWGGMIFALVATARPASWRSAPCLALAFALIIAVETFRLVHAPALDAFRFTLPGQLLLGHVFSPWNMLADAFGAAGVAALTTYCSWYGVRPPPAKP